MGPHNAALQFAAKNKSASSFRVTLYGSLAATGKGHMTDVAILSVLKPIAPTELVWEPTVFLPFHPNGMKFEALRGGAVTNSWLIYSVGGGALANEDTPKRTAEDIYPLHTLSEIQKWCEENGSSYWEYVEQYEGAEIWDFLREVWHTMRNSIENGLRNEGVLPGDIGVRRKAATYLIKAKGYTETMLSRGKLYAYALATSEENAAGGVIVTAPTCGSSGVLPAVLYHLQVSRDFAEIRILRALATAGLFGNIVKTNASISGAEVGCQGEVGVACAMAAAAACQLFGGTPAQIEYAAEMALEHHLGLTCDPVCGLVQIPCIERNAAAAARAFDANIFATFSDGRHRVSFDRVVAVMKETGHDIPSLYKETAEGGLAKTYTPGGGLSKNTTATNKVAKSDKEKAEKKAEKTEKKPAKSEEAPAS
jgi:L-serine dehydratase